MGIDRVSIGSVERAFVVLFSKLPQWAFRLDNCAAWDEGHVKEDVQKSGRVLFRRSETTLPLTFKQILGSARSGGVAWWHQRTGWFTALCKAQIRERVIYSREELALCCCARNGLRTICQKRITQHRMNSAVWEKSFGVRPILLIRRVPTTSHSTATPGNYRI